MSKLSNLPEQVNTAPKFTLDFEDLKLIRAGIDELLLAATTNLKLDINDGNINEVSFLQYFKTNLSEYLEDLPDEFRRPGNSAPLLILGHPVKSE